MRHFCRMDTPMNDRFCLNCGTICKGTKTFSVNSSIPRTSPTLNVKDTFSKQFEIDVTPVKKGVQSEKVLCHECFALIGHIARHRQQLQQFEEEMQRRAKGSSYLQHKVRQSNKRQLTLTPGRTPPRCAKALRVGSTCPRLQAVQEMLKAPMDQGKHKRNTFKSRAMELLQRGQYKTMLKLLMKKSDHACQELQEQFASQIREEIRTVNAKSVHAKEPLTADNVMDLSWHLVLGELEELAPTLMAGLKGAITAQRGKRDSTLVEHSEDHLGLLVPGLGGVSLTLLHLRYPHVFKRFQAMNSTMLYRAGNSHKVEKSFNQLGFCLGVNGTKGTVDRIRAGFDDQIHSWKEAIEVENGPFLLHTVHDLGLEKAGHKDSAESDEDWDDDLEWLLPDDDEPEAQYSEMSDSSVDSDRELSDIEQLPPDNEDVTSVATIPAIS